LCNFTQDPRAASGSLGFTLGRLNHRYTERVSKRGYPGPRPWVRRREDPPYQRTHLGEHEGAVLLLGVVLVLLAAGVLLLMLRR
jgi:hypothetical protein